MIARASMRPGPARKRKTRHPPRRRRTLLGPEDHGALAPRSCTCGLTIARRQRQRLSFIRRGSERPHPQPVEINDLNGLEDFGKQAVPTGEAHRLPKVWRIYRRRPGVSRRMRPKLLEFLTIGGSSRPRACGLQPYSPRGRMQALNTTRYGISWLCPVILPSSCVGGDHCASSDWMNPPARRCFIS